MLIVTVFSGMVAAIVSGITALLIGHGFLAALGLYALSGLVAMLMTAILAATGGIRARQAGDMPGLAAD